MTGPIQGWTAQQVIEFYMDSKNGLGLPAACDDKEAIEKAFLARRAAKLRDEKSPTPGIAYAAREWLKRAEHLMRRRPELLQVAAGTCRLEARTTMETLLLPAVKHPLVLASLWLFCGAGILPASGMVRIAIELCSSADSAPRPCLLRRIRYFEPMSSINGVNRDLPSLISASCCTETLGW